MAATCSGCSSPNIAAEDESPNPPSRRHPRDNHTRPAPAATVSTDLRAEKCTLGYGQRLISSDLSVRIPPGSFTAAIDPNACGKSTLLRALSRLLAPHKGAVMLDGKEISRYPAKEVARRIGLLPQSSISPEGITVADLVGSGRYPHQKLRRQWSIQDELAVANALEATHLTELSSRLAEELSGGQRQRVWAAMVLAQGSPEDVVTARTVAEVFGVDCVVIEDPMTGGPPVVPYTSD